MLNRATNRPTFARERELENDAKLVPTGGKGGSNVPLLVAFNSGPHTPKFCWLPLFVLFVCKISASFKGLETHSASFSSVEYNFVVRC